MRCSAPDAGRSRSRITRRGLGRLWAALVLVMLTPLGAMAASDPTRNASPPPSPNPARPTGTVMFQDNFSDGDFKGWVSDSPGVWTVVHGMLRAELPDQRQRHSFLYAGSENWTDYAVDLDMCMMRGVDKGVIVRVEGEDGIGVDLRGPGYQDVVVNHREWPMGRARMTNANTVWHHMRVEVRGNRVKVTINGEHALVAVDKKDRRPNGRIALSAYTGGGGECLVYYDNIVVTQLTDTPETAADAH